MQKKKYIKLRKDLRVQPLFAGFSMQIDHLHPVFSALRLFRKDLPYIQTSSSAFIGWFENQNSEFKSAFRKLENFSKDWTKFLEILSSQSGYCLDGLYGAMPEAIRGGVELFYSGLNKPSYRLNGMANIEDASKNLHSFVLSNARELPNWKYWWGEDALELDLKRPLEHLSCTTLTDLVLQPANFDEVFEKISFDVDRDTLEKISEEFFLKDSFDHAENNLDAQVQYINHATVVVSRGNVSVMVDPLLNFYDHKAQVSLYDYAPRKIDYILITHAHYDHIDLSTLITLRNRIGKILLPRASDIESDFSLKRALENYFPGRVLEVDSFETLGIDKDFSITSLPFQGEHSDLISPKATWLISASGKNLWFGADSRAIDISMHKFIRNKYGSLDGMFIGTVCEGSPLNRAYPHFSSNTIEENSKSRTTKGADHNEIYEMIDALNPKNVYIYALGFEKWLSSFLGEPIKRYSEEFDLLKDLIAEKNIGIKNLSMLINPQNIYL